ncbi:MAG TPA: hypothetical protein ENJ82_01235, partial [Bacteroidetes bacterium]|nr:hypothetical protein [Bacteroidota bacterium]
MIKSLSKGDKDNLMRYTRVRGDQLDHRYLELYRAIEKQERYDEPALKAAFSFRNFSEAKKHLSNLILKVLRIYDEHPETAMQNRLSEIRILLERSLYHYGMKKIRQARVIALREERFEALHILADYELVALPFVISPKEQQNRRVAVVSSRDEAFRNLEIIRRFKDLNDKEIAAILDQASQSGQFRAELVEEVERHPQLAIPDSELPARGRSLRYRILNIIRQQQMDFAGRAEELRQMIGVYDAHDFLIKEEPVRYVFALGAYGISQSVAGRYEEALDAALRLLEIRSDKDIVRRSVFLNFTSNLASYTLNTGDVAPLRENMSYLMSGLKQHSANTPGGTLAYIHYLFAIVLWCAGDIRRANRFAKRVVSAPAGRTNLQAACKCFLLIFALEQGDPDMIMTYARTWRRLWQKKAPQFEIEKGFTDFMVHFVDLPGREDQQVSIAKYLEELKAYF